MLLAPEPDQTHCLMGFRVIAIKQQGLSCRSQGAVQHFLIKVLIILADQGNCLPGEGCRMLRIEFCCGFKMWDCLPVEVALRKFTPPQEVIIGIPVADWLVFALLNIRGGDAAFNDHCQCGGKFSLNRWQQSEILFVSLRPKKGVGFRFNEPRGQLQFFPGNLNRALNQMGCVQLLPDQP